MVLIVLSEYSRFSQTDKVVVDGQETFGVWRQPSWLRQKPEDKYISSYVVPHHQAGRPDNIAHELYGSSLLAWVIVSFNAQHGDSAAANVLNWPPAGAVIQYPAESLIFQELV